MTEEIEDTPVPIPIVSQLGYVVLAEGTIASDYSLRNLNKSLGEAQAEYLPSEKGERNDYNNYSYASLLDIISAVRPSLTKYHLTVSQFPVTDLENKTVSLYTRLVHWDSGEWIQNLLELPAEMALGKDGALKFNQQTVGGTQTYAMKYAYKAIVGIPDSEETIDAGEGEGDLPRRQKQQGQKKNLCPNCGADAIIKGKPEYGGGWVCFSKKGGCGAKFTDEEMAGAISHQPAGAPAATQSAQPLTQRAAALPVASQRTAQTVKRAGKNLVFTVAAVKLWPAQEKVNASMSVAFTGKLFAPDGKWTSEFAVCFHSRLFDLLQSSVGKIIEVSVTESDKDGRHFVDINNVVAITDEHGEYIEYMDGKPVMTGGAQ
jgi:hypothetical protein